MPRRTAVWRSRTGWVCTPGAAQCVYIQGTYCGLGNRLMQEVEHLVNMANQIADNFSFHDDAVDRTSDHLQRFWAPSMLRMLIEFDASGGAGLKPSVRDALKKLPES